ncbi:GTP-binding protein [Streptomyces sp. NPDC059525]|uniref:GTP-binding protein n=1 Tax=Streptomyces sp. NPDC059525 TaxID=3346857 RepID=UPI0036C90760
MAEEKLDRRLPQVGVLTIGDTGHGKTTLTAALSRVCSEVSGSTPLSTEGDARGGTAHVEYESKIRHYNQTDAPAGNCGKNMIFREHNAAVLVVSAADGLGTLTREHVRLARQTHLPSLVVFLNKADMVDDAEKLALVEKEVRELLSTHGFLGNDTPVIVGSALMALEGKDDNELGTTAVKKLVEALDSHAVPAVDQPFLMPIEDVFTVSGRGTVVTGRIKRGTVRAQDPLEIVGVVSLRDTTMTTCVDIKQGRKPLDEGLAGNDCGIALHGINRDGVQRGQVLAKPGTIKPHEEFTAEIYILTREEGGRCGAITDDYQPQLQFDAGDVTGQLRMHWRVESVSPGTIGSVKVRLAHPMAMMDGWRFTINAYGKTGAVGVVSEIFR